MNQQNIERLTSRLMALGCEPSIETQLRCQTCFSPNQFDLNYGRHSGEDACLFSVRVERELDNEYAVKYYVALLRKRIEVPKELQELDKRLSKIDWPSIAKGRSETTIVSPGAIQSAFELLEDLKLAGMHADLLRYKYWQGTSLEHLIIQAPLHKAAWEISERFYFFDDLEVISFNEAVRFLNSRWMEKQMGMRRKLIEKTTEHGSDGSGKGLLLKKKPARSRKQNLLKS